MLHRRRFLAGVGGAAAWPLAARAQQLERMRRIGIMLSGLANDPEMQARIGALRDGLAALGWEEGRNYRFEPRWPVSDPVRSRTDAIDLLTMAPDVVVAGSYLTARALLAETSSVPIVFVNLADPVGGGLVPSLAHTGRNITGFTAFEYSTASKWLDLLREIAPQVTRVAALFGGMSLGATGENFYMALQAAASATGIAVTPLRVSGVTDVGPAINEFAAKPDGGLLTLADGGATINRGPMIAGAARHRLPAVYPFRYYVAEGGLAAYSIDLNDQYRRAAGYVDRILKGASPAGLPVQAPNKFELIINLKAAKAQGITIPPLLLARADEVIE